MYLYSRKCYPFLCVVILVGFLWIVCQQSSAQFAFQSEQNATHQLRVTKIQCVDMPYKQTKLNFCRMGTLPNRTIFMDVSIDAPMPLHYLLVSFKLFYKYTTYRPFMIDWTMEACQAMRYPNRRNLQTRIMLKVIEDTAPEIYYKCPHGNRTYNVTWTFTSKYLLTTIPSGNYRMDIRMTDRDADTLFAFQAFVSVRKQGLIG